MPRRKDPITIDMQVLPSSRVKESARAERRVSMMLVVLTAVSMSAPLLFGTTEPWSQFIQRTAALSLFGFWIACQWSRDEVTLPSGIILPTCAFGFLVLLQLMIGTTAYRYATISESLNLIAYGCLILVAGEVFTRRRRLHGFLVFMALYGFAVALFSLIQGLSGTDKIYWLRTVDWAPDGIYGPYVNHNHFAGLMEMLIPLAAGAAMLERGSKQLLLLFVTAIMALSVAFSRSRGGMIAVTAELIFSCFVLMRHKRNMRAVMTTLATVTGVTVAVILLGTKPVLARFTDTADYYRLAMLRDSLAMAMHKPILGFGLGTFSTVYPPFRSFYTSLFVNHVHNDFAELFVETGFVGLGIFVWFLVAVFRNGFVKILDKNDIEGSWLTLAALTGVVGLLIHSLVDFNLHIPANAALFFVLCSAVAVPFQNRIKRLESSSAEELRQYDEADDVQDEWPLESL